MNLSQKCGDGVRAELRCVEAGRGQAAEGIGDILRRDAPGFGRRLSGQQIGKNGTRCDRCDTALSSEPSGSDAAIFEAYGKAQDIAAYGIGDFDSRRGVRKVAGIMRISKMIEKRFAKHRRQYRAALSALDMA